MQEVNDFVIVKRPAAFDVGWEGGLRVDRDTTTLGTGGNPGNTVHTLMVWNKIGQGNKNREFSLMTLVENYSNQPGAEGVGEYIKAVKLGSSGTWAGCDEANDPQGLPGPLVTREFDIFACGPATDLDIGDTHNGGRVRVAVDIVGGDEPQKQGQAFSGGQGSAGLRIYSTSTTPDFRWLYGTWVTDYLRTGARYVGKKLGGWTPERAIDIRGDHVVGIDFSNGNFQSVMRVKMGSNYSFDAFDQVNLRRMDDRFQLLNNGVPVFEIDINTGDIYKKGVKVL